MGMEYGNRIGIDGEDNLILTGATGSLDIDTHRAYQRSKSGGLDAYLLKFSVEDNTTIFSTYLGGDNHEWGFNLAIDQKNNIYLIGQSISENFPTRNAQQNAYGGAWDGFVAKFSQSGRLLSSSYVGGSGMDFGFAVSLNSDNYIAFVFFTESTDLQIQKAFQSENSGTVDFYIIQMKFHTVWWIWTILGIIIVSIFLLVARHQLLKNRKATKIILPNMEAENKN